VRRRTVLGLASALLAAPGSLVAQTRERVYRLGAFQFGQNAVMEEHMQALRARLKQLGFAEGRNLQISEARSSFDAQSRRESAAALIRTKPDVVLAFGSTNTRAIQEASAGKIPVVFAMVGDPVAYGIVRELARPGGNLTGVGFLQRELTVKRLELLREVMPKARRVVVAAFVNDVTYSASEPLLRQTAARLGLELVAVELFGEPSSELGRAIQGGADAVFVYQPISFVVGPQLADTIVRLATARRIPVFFAESGLVARGGFLSYGPEFLDETRRAADQVAKILRGARAGDLPVEQSARFELVVNLKVAQALGIEIPLAVRPRVDRIFK
jgi:putative ABC transport system substrate-binding protein